MARIRALFVLFLLVVWDISTGVKSYKEQLYEDRFSRDFERSYEAEDEQDNFNNEQRFYQEGYETRSVKSSSVDILMPHVSPQHVSIDYIVLKSLRNTVSSASSELKRNGIRQPAES